MPSEPIKIGNRPEDSSIVPVTVSDFANIVLGHKEGGVEVLIGLAQNNETDWLELKAALYPENGQYDPGKTQDDYYWHIVEAIIALANTHGGIILLGVKNDGSPYGLTASDPHHNLDKGFDNFVRTTLDNALNHGGKPWKLNHGVIKDNKADKNRKKSLSINTDHQKIFSNCWQAKHCKYHDYDIAVIIVNRTENIILVEDSIGHATNLYYRRSGDVGECKNIWNHNKISQYCEEREKTGRKFESLLNKFNKCKKSIEQPYSLESSIKKYNAKASWGKKENELDDTIPLECAELTATNENIPQNNSETDKNFFTNTDKETDINRFVLTGLPGSGKTHMLKHECFKLIQSYLPGDKVAVYIRLKEFDSDKILYDYIIKETGFSPEECDYLLKLDRFYLFLDGLNECSYGDVDSCVRDIRNIICNFRGISIVLTMTTHYLKDQLKLKDIPAYEIQPLKEAAQQELFARLLIKNKNKAGEILKQLIGTPGAGIIAANPLGLELIAEIYNSHEELELTSVSHLLKDYFKLWFKKTLTCDESYETVLENIGWLATYMRMENENSEAIPLALIKKKFGGEWTEKDGFIDKIIEGGLFEINKNNELSFSRVVFNDYFTAEFLIKEPRYVFEKISLLLAKEMPAAELENLIDRLTMPLIYYLELANGSPDKDLFDVLSKLKRPMIMPFIVIFIAKNKIFADQARRNFATGRLFKTMPAKYKIIDLLVELFYTKKSCDIDALPSDDMMNLFTDKPWRYLIATNPMAKQRWGKFITNITKPGTAILLVNNGLAAAGDFESKLEDFIKKTDDKTAIKLYKSGIAGIESFKHNPGAAIALINDKNAIKIHAGTDNPNDEQKNCLKAVMKDTNMGYWKRNASKSEFKMLDKAGLID